MHTSASGHPDARSLITAAVAAGIPAGLLFAVAGYLMALPPLLTAETVEQGVPALAGARRLLWGVAGSVALSTALALVLTPIVRAAGAPALRTGMKVGALAFVAVFLLPMLVTRPGPPGVEHAGPLALRQGVWLGTVLLSAAAWGAGAWVHRLLTRRFGMCRCAKLGAAGAGLFLWGVGLALMLHLTGFTPGPEPGAVSPALQARFGTAMVAANACLFAALGLLIPPALRRFCP
jgi:predicted cobalt transporter CbtA